LESASGGTLFLDEVGDIPLAMQVKLLRLLESGTYRRVGSTDLRRTDVRVVAATHRDLQAMVADGRFREDLFYRLSTFPIHLPPLRERGQDIPLLAVALLARVAPERRLTMSRDALAQLSAHPFPGNVRELRNVLERAALMTDGAVMGAEHVARALSSGNAVRASNAAAPASTPAPSPAVPVGPALLRDAEAAVIRTAALAHKGSRAELARQLGISERSLYRKLRMIEDAG
jgi:DNA-binding NtrC family response regulator